MNARALHYVKIYMMHKIMINQRLNIRHSSPTQGYIILDIAQK